jgi:hypothetical protein
MEMKQLMSEDSVEASRRQERGLRLKAKNNINEIL